MRYNPQTLTMKIAYIALSLGILTSPLQANKISEDQARYVKQYAKQKKKVAPEDARINTDPEPDLSSGFTKLYNEKDLQGWIPRGGTCTFEADGDSILSTCVVGSPSTYLSTEREDYSDFIFTAELYWEVDCNSGIMFRAQRKPGKKFENVYGPQCEMEGFRKKRGWSGGIYGQGAGGWFYPLWLEAHAEARAKHLKENDWNRVTIQAIGKEVKTWVNGRPAAFWIDEEYGKGYIALQMHSGPKGVVRFRDIKIKELTSQDLLANDDLSQWTQVNGHPINNGWTITDGILTRSGEYPGSIITKKHYKDFDLTFDWKISQAGNSGIKYRTRGNLGLEYQILDDAAAKDSKKANHRAASLYDLVAAPDDKPYHPADNWNTGRIRIQNNLAQHWINGVKVVEIQIGSEDWNQRFTASKYHEHQGFGTWTGPILLQDHKDPVAYKNIQIREL